MSVWSYYAVPCERHIRVRTGAVEADTGQEACDKVRALFPHGCSSLAFSQETGEVYKSAGGYDTPAGPAIKLEPREPDGRMHMYATEEAHYFAWSMDEAARELRKPCGKNPIYALCFDDRRVYKITYAKDGSWEEECL